MRRKVTDGVDVGYVRSISLVLTALAFRISRRAERGVSKVDAGYSFVVAKLSVR